MSAEKFFWGAGGSELLEFWYSVSLAVGVSSCVYSCFAVRFNMVCGAIQCC